MPMTCPKCGGKMRPTAKICVKCRRVEYVKKYTDSAVTGLKNVGYASMILGYNIDRLGGKRKLTYADRGLDMDATDFDIPHSHKKPNAQ